MCSKPSLSLCIYLLRQFVTVAASLGLSRVQGRRRTDIQKIGKPMNSTQGQTWQLMHGDTKKRKVEEKKISGTKRRDSEQLSDGRNEKSILALKNQITVQILLKFVLQFTHFVLEQGTFGVVRKETGEDIL